MRVKVFGEGVVYMKVRMSDSYDVYKDGILHV